LLKTHKTPFSVGLTGGIASGKSTVCQLFAQLFVPIIDADIIARQLVEIGQPALTEIKNLFGQKILHQDGSLNRKNLSQVIFNDLTAKQQLESILHPKIRQEIIRQQGEQQSSYLIIDIPLLIEAKMTDLVQHILVIDLPKKQQRSRLSLRDNITVDNADIMIENQCSREQHLAVADDIIINDQSIEELKQQIFKLDKKYRQLANSCHHDDSHGQ